MTIKDKLTLPTAEEIAIAQECSREISAYLETSTESQQIDISSKDGEKHALSIPTRALSLLVDILAQLGQGECGKNHSYSCGADHSASGRHSQCFPPLSCSNAGSGRNPTS